MRIDGTSLIAAQSAFQPQRTQQAVPQAAQPADKPLFEPLNFPKTEPLPSPSKPHPTGTQTASLRPGTQLDITV